MMCSQKSDASKAHFLEITMRMKAYQVPPRCMAYMLQESFKKELEWLEEQQVIAPLGIDETATVLSSNMFAKWYCIPMPGSHMAKPGADKVIT